MMTPNSSKDKKRNWEKRFSLIIPAYNEEAVLPALLDTVDIARNHYRSGADAIEIIVADNTSTDETAKIANLRNCRVVQEEKRIIAAVRNKGASIAKGHILAFVDADARIHPETFNEIDKSLATGNVIAGATGVKLQRMSFGIAMAYAVMVPMVWATGMDTGMVFCSHEDFLTIGGYNEERRFAEDVQFLWDLKKLGRSRKQKLARVTSAKAISSTRKFDEFGDWHYLSMIFRFFFWSLFSPSRFDSFANKYWYGNQRQRKEKQ